MRLTYSLPALALAACMSRPPETTDPAATAATTSATIPCDVDNGGLVLPDSFCATLVGDSLGEVRQLLVAPSGVVYAALQHDVGEGVIAVADRDGDGSYETREQFGPFGGNDVEIHDNHLYYALPDRIVRWPLPPGATSATGAIVPDGPPEVIVAGLPAEDGHVAKSIAFLGDTMIVNVGSETNSCQVDDRKNRSPGHDPCRELLRRAGLWAFAASTVGQQYRPEFRWATGLRNTMALAVHPATGDLLFAVHGRDQLHQNWGFSEVVSAENPAEEFGVVKQDDDFGWPYCYYSHRRGQRVTAPEYGGDGEKADRCGGFSRPLVMFPGHWAPMALLVHSGAMFGADYRGGVFLAFHGSWNRAPLPQAGFRVVFIPFANGRPSGEYKTFATAASGPTGLRAAGVAEGPDGSLYISDDRRGAIWRVMRR